MTETEQCLIEGQMSARYSKHMAIREFGGDSTKELLGTEILSYIF